MIEYGDMAVMLTAWRRPGYLRKALSSWDAVRHVHDLRAFEVCLDPSDRQDEMENVCREFGHLAKLKRNPEKYGVLCNPRESMSYGFTLGAQFCIIADDDMLVSDDVLEYFRWAASEFEDDKSVAAVCAHTPEPAPAEEDQEGVELLPRYRCWIWSTWRDRWASVLLPNFDGDYSSGNPSGYDWNYDLRVIPQFGLKCVFPAASRSQNIGKFEGVHASPAEFASTYNPSFREHREPVAYRIRG